MIDWILDHLREGIENWGHPDKIRATKISSRLNKGNKDLTGQVGQADEHRFHPRLIWKNWLLESEKRNSE